MEVLEIYTKDNIDSLMVDSRSTKEIMDNFFRNYPSSYRRNYDRNLKKIQICRVDEYFDFDGSGAAAKIYLKNSKIILSNLENIIHELMHMAHYDRKKDLLAISSKELLWEDPLIEGATEFLSSKAIGKPCMAYIFESFVVDMLSSIDNFFEPFFIPNYKKFIKMFPCEKDILTLMYALSFYYFYQDIEYENPNYDVVSKKLGEAIKTVINALISIESSIFRDETARDLYSEKFMDLITSEFLELHIIDYFSDYKDYTYEQLKTRILRR